MNLQTRVAATRPVRREVRPSEKPLALDTILVGDCVEQMARLPDKCVDMIFADPPYNLQLGGDLFRPEGGKVDACDDDWDKFDSLTAYDNFTRDWLAEARRILKDDGTIWVIGSYHNIYRVGALLQDEGYWILNDIVWRKTNPMPNFRGTRFTNAHETLLWCAKGEKSRYHFNYQAMKALNEDVQMRSDWLFPICSGGERVKDEAGDKAHPTQKPEALLYRSAGLHQAATSCSTRSSARDDGGRRPPSGPALDRDRAEKTYVEVATKRIASTLPLDESAIKTITEKREQPRVAFGTLVENGMVAAGSILMDSKRRWAATVRADGTIAGDGQSGSIHKVGAALQGAPSCNGWTFWHIDGEPLDSLRQRHLSAL